MRFLKVGRFLSFEGKVPGYVGFEVRFGAVRRFAGFRATGSLAGLCDGIIKVSMLRYLAV
jgi:hypothetical protein